VVLSDRHHHGFAKKIARNDIRIVHRRTDHREIDFAGLQQLDLYQPQVHIRISIGKISEPGREKIRHNCRDAADSKSPSHAEPQRFERAARVVHLAQNVGCLRQQGASE
jgi:hypothetical protein